MPRHPEITDRMNKYEVQYETYDGHDYALSADEGSVFLDLIRRNRNSGGFGSPVSIEAACSGNGTCGKCGVQVLAGHAPATEEDRRFFTKQELDRGYRLACRLKITGPLTVRALGGQMQAEDLQIQMPGLNGAAGPREADAVPVQNGGSLQDCGIAVDLGSTTLAAVLTGPDGQILAQTSGVNSQRIYGADVISRMQASNEGKREELRACICRDLEKMFCALIETQEQELAVTRIAAAGNTTMLHLLRGYSCETLGRYPFEPVSLELECLEFEQLFSDIRQCRGCKVYLLPGMSAFAGADITAGLYSSGFWDMPQDETAFFIDLGTNGELACGSSAGFVTAAAAAGPAFEGGKLSCGIPGIPGAVSKVSYLYHKVRIQTIGQKKPCGICGTGALEAVCALRREGLLDADGLLVPQLFETGMEIARRADGTMIRITQADIREIQMAKAAIRAGIEILLEKYAQYFGGGRQFFISRVFLAGGFGYYLSADTAAAAGLFPKEWKDRVISCGNTSLKGAAAFLTDGRCKEELEQICRKNRSVRLESDPKFQDIYVGSMGFD